VHAVANGQQHGQKAMPERKSPPLHHQPPGPRVDNDQEFTPTTPTACPGRRGPSTVSGGDPIGPCSIDSFNATYSS
jgi:hypothetical protein